MPDTELEAPVEVGLLGPVQLASPTGVVEIASARRRALLAALVLRRGQVVPPEDLIRVLWGEQTPPSAAVSLRSHLARLRALLVDAGLPTDVLRWHAGGYVLDPAAVGADVVRFERARVAARSESDPDRAVSTLRAGLAAWRGPALVEFADQDWARADAVRLEDARCAAVEELAAAELAADAASVALDLLDEHVRANPLREHAWGLRMRALYRLGRPADALASYRELRALLARELGMDPTPALRDLERQILRHDPDLDPGFRASTRPAEARVAPVEPSARFVGRVDERATALAAVERAVAGRGGMVLVGGEPGIGKTRLAAEVAAAAEARGLAVWVGHSYEMAGAPPYVALIEILEAGLAASDPVVFRDHVLGDAAPEVARLVPRLRRLFPDLPAALELPAEAQQRYLFACLVDVTRRAAARCPMVIVLDDLQWADEPTLAFVERLAGHVAELPVLLLATFRDVGMGPGLARLLGDLHRRRQAEQISLGGLHPAESADLVQALTVRPDVRDLASALHDRTDGHPFFIEEVVRDLVAREAPIDLTRHQLDVPGGVRMVITRRVDGLSPLAQRVLTAAAVAGRVFTYRLVRELLDADADDLLDALDEIRRTVLILDADGGFLFTHELIRQTVLAELSAPRRRRLHRQVAEALERIWADRLDEQAATIVHHLEAAGDEVAPAATLPHLVRAGRRALATYANAEAVDHLERAALLAPHAPAAEQPELFAALGDARQRVGRNEAAVDAMRRAIAGYRAIGAEDRAGQLCLDATYALATDGRMQEADALLEEGLAATDGHVTGTRARLLSYTATLRCWLDPTASEEMFADARAIADRLDDDDLRGDIAADVCLACHGLLLPSRGHEAFAVADPHLRASGDQWRHTVTLWAEEIHLLNLGRPAESAAIGEEVVVVGGRVGQRVALMIHERAVGLRRWFSTGDHRVLADLGHRDLQTCAEMDWPHWASHSYAWQGLAEFLAGDWVAAEALLRKANDGARGPALGGCTWAVWLTFLTAAGRTDEALGFLDDLADELPRAGETNRWGQWALLLAAVDTLAGCGRSARAAALYPLVLEALATGAVTTGYVEGRLLQRAAGTAAAAGGAWEQAEGHFTAALATADAMPHRFEAAETHRAYAAMLRARRAPGDARRANALLAEAADAYRRMHMPRHVSLIG